MAKRYEVGTTDKDLTIDMQVVRAVDFDKLEAALQKIKDMVCGEARPRWDFSPETTGTRGVIADICDSVLMPNAQAKRRGGCLPRPS